MTEKAYKQTRFDLLEIREKWPKLRELNWWDMETINRARRLSEKLNRTVVRLREVEAKQYERAKADRDKAENNARRMCKTINMIFDALAVNGERAELPRAIVCEDGNVYGYIALTGWNQSYSLID